jgi:hypothetical protein
MSVSDERLAELIADYGETCKRPPFECLSEVLACLRELRARREQALRLTTAVKRYLRALHDMARSRDDVRDERGRLVTIACEIADETED